MGGGVVPLPHLVPKVFPALRPIWETLEALVIANRELIALPCPPCLVAPCPMVLEDEVPEAESTDLVGLSLPPIPIPTVPSPRTVAFWSSEELDRLLG
jgi:hypothetical protein